MQFRGVLTDLGPVIGGSIAIRGLPSPQETILFIDPGSTDTVLSAKDALRLGIARSMMTPVRAPGLSLGGIVREWELAGAVFRLQDVERVPVDFPMARVRVHRIPKTSRVVSDALRRIPSILGHDFLSRFGIRLALDYGTGEVVLHTGHP